jgi:D-aspartate ligase
VHPVADSESQARINHDAFDTTSERPLQAIVLGGHVTALGIVRALGGVVKHCEVWDRTSRSISRFSRFTHRFRQLDVLCEDRVTDELFCFAEDAQNTSTFVFPTDDITTGIISRQRDKLIDAGFIPVADRWENVKQFYYKEQTYALADKIGIPRPRTTSLDENAELNDDVRYPLILKPNVIATFHSIHHRKAVLCNSPEETKANFERYSALDGGYQLMAQELIPGPSRNQYSYSTLRMNGQILGAVMARRKRQYPLDFGTGTFVETCTFPKVREYSVALIEASNYNGISEVEFKFDERDGQLKLFEVNPRLYKWHALGLQIGLNFPEMFISAALGKATKRNVITSSNQHVAWRDIFSDVAGIAGQIRSGGTSIGELIGELRIRPRDSVFSLSDLKPFGYLIYLLPWLAAGGRDAL